MGVVATRSQPAESGLRHTRQTGGAAAGVRGVPGWDVPGVRASRPGPGVPVPDELLMAGRSSVLLFGFFGAVLQALVPYAWGRRLLLQFPRFFTYSTGLTASSRCAVWRFLSGGHGV